ncbi:MAG: hypothetical protein HGA76_03040 [Candidatus Firestonebacteria bacterium]|nr:hypothetical protein [Candidatus Firestonebacteria bacterium]
MSRLDARSRTLTVGVGIFFICFAAAMASAEQGASPEKSRVVFDARPAPAAFPGAAVPVAASGEIPPNAYNRIIAPETLMVSKKKGYLFIVWDVFPLRDRFAPGDAARDTAALRYAAYLALAYGFAKYPGFPEARVNLIAFKARDEYGGPRWDLAEKWHLYTFRAETFKAQGITQPESLWALAEKKLRLLPGPPAGQAP